MSLRAVALGTGSIFALCAYASLHASSEDGLLVLRAIQSFCTGINSVLLFVTIMATFRAATREMSGWRCSPSPLSGPRSTVWSPIARRAWANASAGTPRALSRTDQQSLDRSELP